MKMHMERQASSLCHLHALEQCKSRTRKYLEHVQVELVLTSKFTPIALKAAVLLK